MTVSFEHKTAGTKVYMSPTVNYTIATLEDFEAIADWVELDNLIDAGSIGPEANIITQGYVNDPFVHKLTGLIDNGTMEMVFGHNPLSAGQKAFAAAVQAHTKHAFRIVYTDKPTDTGTPTTDYFRGVPASAKLDLAEADNVVKLNASVAIDGAIFSVPADITAVWSPAGPALTGGVEATPYAGVTLAATGGIGSPTYALAAGDALPAGLTLNASTGEISGTPTTAGTYDFDVVATWSGFGEDSNAYQIVVTA